MKTVVLWIGFRNLTGDPRRTLLTVSAIAVGLAALVFLWGFNDGLHRNMLGNFQSTLVGSLQIHRQGFFSNPELARHIEKDAPILAALKAAGVGRWTRRLETYTLVASDSATEGSFLIAMDPRTEPRVTRLGEKVTQGRFFRPGDEYVCVLGAASARNLGVGVGDSVVLVAYDRFGALTAKDFRLIGIVSGGGLGIDRGLVLTPLGAAQEMLDMQGRITDIPIWVPPERLETVTGQLRRALAGRDLEVLRWYDMFPVMHEWVTLHNAFLYLFLGIVLLIVLAGVVNTLLVSMLERIREFGIHLALGNRRLGLFVMVLSESLWLGLAGIAAGVLGGIGLVALTAHTGIDLSLLLGDTQRFYVDPLVRPHLDLRHLGQTLAAVLGITLAAGLYPAWRASRLSPVEALRHV